MTSPSADRLWVPLLTHYAARDEQIVFDPARQGRHVAAIRPCVSQFLLAGSTGDGWEMGDDLFSPLLQWAAGASELRGCTILFGALRETTAQVVERAQTVERRLEQSGPPPPFTYAGLAVCPPVKPGATQDEIIRHYKIVLEQTSSPIAVYQLPQVTGCSLTPASLRTLSANPRITMFKDTSGTDSVAKGGPIGKITMVRGAEGGYVDALKPTGPYDGWLLSTGNAFGPLLRRMLDHTAAGDAAQAKMLSAIMTALIDYLFGAAQPLPFGNAFSNANRAVDHLLAHGTAWRRAKPPLTRSGNRLPMSLLDAAAQALAALPGVTAKGYLAI